MPGHFQPPQNTFIVRFWREWQGSDAEQFSGWRGRIEHIQSGQGINFYKHQQMLDFIEQMISGFPLTKNSEDNEQNDDI
ncbi:MAG: hypothetical protein ANABAC_1089 [Anaerolineae bacterium]|nr:MAG: hypothetical protein ANABAC_1089 [Anaerolineae bacterium]